MLQALQALTIAVIAAGILLSGAVMVTFGRGSSGHESVGGWLILLGFVVAFIAVAQASLARAYARTADRPYEEAPAAGHLPVD